MKRKITAEDRALLLQLCASVESARSDRARARAELFAAMGSGIDPTTPRVKAWAADLQMADDSLARLSAKEAADKFGLSRQYPAQVLRDYIDGRPVSGKRRATE